MHMRRYGAHNTPLRPELSPEEEFFAFIGRFPSIAAQFAGARAAQAWARFFVSESVTYSATAIAARKRVGLRRRRAAWRLEATKELDP
jgi:hypothetical protein